VKDIAKTGTMVTGFGVKKEGRKPLHGGSSQKRGFVGEKAKQGQGRNEKCRGMKKESRGGSEIPSDLVFH